MEDKDTPGDLQFFIWFVNLQNKFCLIQEVLKNSKGAYMTFDQFSTFDAILGRPEIWNFTDYMGYHGF